MFGVRLLFFVGFVGAGRNCFLWGEKRRGGWFFVGREEAGVDCFYMGRRGVVGGEKMGSGGRKGGMGFIKRFEKGIKKGGRKGERIKRKKGEG